MTLRRKDQALPIKSGEELNFLGYTFQYQNKFSHKYKLFKERIEQSGIACYPQKVKVQAILRKIKETFRKSTNKSVYELIAELNPIIRG